MLNTTRCHISDIKESDFESLKLLWMDDQVRLYLGGAIKDESSLQMKFNDLLIKTSQNGSYFFTIRLQETGEFVGLVSLDEYHDGNETEISYELLPSYWGMGLGTEIIGRVIKYAFDDLGLKKVVAVTQTANKKSCKLLESVGMVLIKKINRFGTKQAVYYKDKP
ncbi:GNAT family N-acetyltransferase [Paenibacillus sp. J5C_2022]|uniref:GNAT family N-acetyltransferase n=1 Tax=Paenibacillus sp. J5C2022 TaxID=2977129 RepID=UPI0021D1CFC0|nr:GNAT family N-acetyltransferase [Paenibacillus sp. J5C2022]MCU6713143.1 GNAT family N-acetyltransferase [Paenibacillus sp. J5C2022]